MSSLLVSGVSSLNEVLTGSERVRDTPLPEAYCIAISQISWIYILALPFQLVSLMNWIAIPGSVGECLFFILL
jgi:ion channel-forming bestrophin family protein